MDAPDSSRDELVVTLGQATLRAGLNVTEVFRLMGDIAAARGAVQPEIAVFPTFIAYHDARGRQSITRSVPQGSLSARQIMRIDGLIDQARDPQVPADQVVSDLRRTLEDSTSSWTVVLGYAVASAGFATILGANLVTALVSALVALPVFGVLRLLRRDRFESLALIGAAAVASILTSCAALTVDSVAPLYAALSCIALLIPSVGVITATEELAGAEMVSGSSRLVYSVIQMALLAVAIYVGHVAVSPRGGFGLVLSPPTELEAAIGAATFVLGVIVYTQAPWRAGIAMATVGAFTFAAQQSAQHFVSKAGALGFAAFVGLTLALVVQRRRWFGGPPSTVVFAPSFWMLLPGAVTLGAIISTLGGEPVSASSDQTLVLSFSSLLIGCLLGSIIGGAVRRRQS